ncbi:hypothetical protein G6F31_018524 [Rhizopus arrhizus]|nr:hypothetical protein G6F31_018524 [Rhizopus arrhizus]KAG1391137.1 hypothetical protein G6F59_014987 [Rhizopus arrhizus]
MHDLRQSQPPTRRPRWHACEQQAASLGWRRQPAPAHACERTDTAEPGRRDAGDPAARTPAPAGPAYAGLHVRRHT